MLHELVSALREVGTDLCDEAALELEQQGSKLEMLQKNYDLANAMTAIREALGLSEFDSHEVVIDEIKLKLALLATQAERVAELESGGNGDE